MSIPLTQLQTWSTKQDVSILTETYKYISDILKKFSVPDQTISPPYLQGSYANSTSIYGKGDIDVVMELTSLLYHNATVQHTNSIPSYNCQGPTFSNTKFSSSPR